MNAGLVRQALRKQPWAFAGPFVTQCLAAALVSGALGASSSLSRARLDPAARRALTESLIPEMAVLFVVVSVYLTALIVGLTMTSSIARQGRDIALVRAVGATPGRVRRAVAAQAAVVAVPATVLGVPLGALFAHAWLAGLTGHGVIPPGVTFHPSAAALPAALGITVGASLVGALVAAVRPARVRPATALTETAVPPRRVSVVRTAIGVVLVAGGVVLSILMANGDPAKADGSSFFTMLAMCVGAGFLGPVLLRLTAPLARLFGGTGTMAADNLAVRAKALSGALVPLVLAIAFAMVKVVAHTTSVHVHGAPEPAAQVWTEYSGTAVYVAFAAVAAVNTLVTVLLARRRELAVTRLVGASRARALAVVVCEALTVTITALVVGTVVAMVTMVPMLHGMLGTWTPYLPSGQLAGGLAAVIGLVLLGTVVPALVAMRRPPVESLAVDP
ncbi:ABC transporter permease [Micromonospora sp. PPF5-17]|uniref:ABC transporter permease n=1 Tax=Micromonospora solifontis TaxID=2487138 RepID=A0ABX9W8Y0_9ACTN|nr:MULTISPECIES: ABC transporter permease [Micromonospora]NES39509.1 ABC transporter permease [Micromonospora solifontis]NES59049.1 ABC transporter permease [Micromonospora sp. PPF5-6]RNL88363.1 ABC transporter permease [Micromonospora solifontis]